MRGVWNFEIPPAGPAGGGCLNLVYCGKDIKREAVGSLKSRPWGWLLKLGLLCERHRKRGGWNFEIPRWRY